MHRCILYSCGATVQTCPRIMYKSPVEDVPDYEVLGIFLHKLHRNYCKKLKAEGCAEGCAVLLPTDQTMTIQKRFQNASVWVPEDLPGQSPECSG